MDFSTCQIMALESWVICSFQSSNSKQKNHIKQMSLSQRSIVGFTGYCEPVRHKKTLHAFKRVSVFCVQHYKDVRPTVRPS